MHMRKLLLDREGLDHNIIWLNSIISEFKKSFVLNKSFQEAEDWQCGTCNKTLRELPEYSSCTEPHPCSYCRYHAYINGIFMGCLCKEIDEIKLESKLKINKEII